MTRPETTRRGPQGAPCGSTVPPVKENVSPQWVDATATGGPQREPFGPPPASVSPSEWVASEGTLIRMLCRHYGWMTLQPGQLIRHNLAKR